MCFDICTINIRVSIRVRGLHLVIIAFEYLQAYRIELAISGNIHLGHLQGHRMSSADCGQQWDTIKDVLKSNRIS
jgi:hypothetical protein